METSRILYKTRSNKLIMLPVVIIMVLLSGQVCFSHPVGSADFDFQGQPLDEAHGSHLTGRVYNFSDTCPEIQLVLEETQINVDNLVLTGDEADIIAKLLLGFSLKQRVNAWCLTAKIRLFSEDENPTVSFDIRDLETFEGDMLLNNEQLQDVYDSILIERDYTRSQGALPDLSQNHILDRVKRKITVTKDSKWPTDIPWRFKSNYSFTHKLVIMRALDNWESLTCLRFSIKTDDKKEPHMVFVDVGGCYAAVGMYAQSNGQVVAVTAGCMSVGSVSHEIGHSLGMWHEQSRPDRDDYVTINKNNMNFKSFPNFYKYGWGITFTAQVPYDYGSIMHYGAGYFGQNGKDTITPIWPYYERTMGDRSQISFYDAKAINNHYCSDACNDTSLSWSECENDGYRDPNNCSQCMCQVGWAPPFCKSLVANLHEDECGEQVVNARRTIQFLHLSSYFQEPLHYRVHTRCVWSIKAPAGMRVQAEFYGEFDLTCATFACVDYVEIRYGDLARVGPRFCCNHLPNMTFESHGREMIVLFTAQAKSKNTHKGFLIKYKAETCGGCHPFMSRDTEPVCKMTIRYHCVVNFQYRCIRLGICSIARNNICYRVAEYCCAGYSKNGTECIRNPPTTPATTPTTTSTTVSV